MSPAAAVTKVQGGLSWLGTLARWWTTPTPTTPSVPTRASIIYRIVDETGFDTTQATCMVNTYLRVAGLASAGQLTTDELGRKVYELTDDDMAAHEVMVVVTPDDMVPAQGSIHADLVVVAGGVVLIHGEADDNCCWVLALADADGKVIYTIIAGRS